MKKKNNKFECVGTIQKIEEVNGYAWINVSTKNAYGMNLIFANCYCEDELACDLLTYSDVYMSKPYRFHGVCEGLKIKINELSEVC